MNRDPNPRQARRATAVVTDQHEGERVTAAAVTVDELPLQKVGGAEDQQQQHRQDDGAALQHRRRRGARYR